MIQEIPPVGPGGVTMATGSGGSGPLVPDRGRLGEGLRAGPDSVFVTSVFFLAPSRLPLDYPGVRIIFPGSCWRAEQEVNSQEMNHLTVGFSAVCRRR